MIATTDLYWAAGFLEGEGSFGMYMPPRHTAWVSAVQIQREPLERLYGWFGGNISTTTTRGKTIYAWRLSSYRAIALMMTLYKLLSPRRKEQVRRVLEHWRQRQVPWRFRALCAKGHPYTPARNTTGRRRRECRPCDLDRAKTKSRARYLAKRGGYVRGPYEASAWAS